MKKLIYCALALAAGLFATSCQQENLEPVAQENTVTYTVEVPEAMTKAIGDGTNVNSLVYEVWKTDEAGERDLAEGKTGIRLYQKTINLPEGAPRKWIVTLNLVKNQNYTVLFWAQNAEAGAYNTSNLTSVTYKNTYGPENTQYFSNQEGYAAFYHAEFISETSPRSKRIELRRPFAQVNIATTNSTNDGGGAELYEIKMTSSKVTIKNVPTVFNVAGNISKATAKETGEQVTNGATPSTTTFVFDEAYLPNCTSAVDAVSTHNVAGQPYEYAAMNYIFANGTVDVTYEINTVLKAIGGSTSTTAKVVNTVYSVPVEENYRTNIVGNLLTSTTEYEVIVDADWAGEPDEPYVVDVVSVASAQELLEVVESATTEGETNIKLEGDIDLNDLFNVQLFSTKAGNDDAPASLVIPAGKEIVLDLQGYTLSQKVKVAGHAMITNNGMLTLKGNGKVVYTYTGEGDSTNSKGNYTIVNNNKLTIDGPTVENATAKMSHAFYAVHNAGDLHIKSGKVLNTNNCAIRLWIGASKATSVVMDGGVVEGTRAVWAQLPSSAADAPVHNFTMNGGKLIGTGESEEYKLAIYSYNYGNSLENVSFTFNDGEVEGDIALTGGKNKENIETLNINGGTFNGEVYSYGDTEKAAEAITIKGGVICGLDVLAYVKSQDESVEVKLTEDVELTSGYKFENEVASITIDGNGKAIKVMKADTGRVIDFTSATNGANLTLKNLTIENNISWVERIVNYNTCGTLTLENVMITNAEGCSSNYAVNLPASSDKANVVINNSEIWAGANALNLWGAETVANITDSKLYVVDSNAVEGYSVVSLNNAGENAAHNSTINVLGGEVKVVYKGEGETMPSSAFRDATVGSVINISETTVVVGEIKIPVANVVYEGYDQFYSFSTLQAAIDKVEEDNNGSVRMIKDLTLPLAYKAIYGTPVAVQIKKGALLDGDGHYLNIENPVYEGYAIETYGGTIKNLKITSPVGRGIIISSPKQDVVLENIFIDGPGYALNTTEHNGKKLVVTNSTFKGWTSLAGLERVSFTSCTFGENTYKYWQKYGYDQDYDRLVRPYVQTLFDSCVFENGFYVDLSALAATSTITLKDCVCDGVELTAENYSNYITVELPEGRTLADSVVFE